MATAWRADEQQAPSIPPVKWPLRVLVVEDNPDCALSLAMLLRHNGFAVDIATTGSAALASIQDSLPDVVLMDIGLPEMDGYQVAGRMRSVSAKKPLLIALTGYGQEADRQRSRDEGFDYHFVKPADPLELMALLNEYARSIAAGDAIPAVPGTMKWKPDKPPLSLLYCGRSS
jgi:DNA-binding response OmpR family regulator